MIHRAESTHPVVAALDHPLFAFGEKRELKNVETHHMRLFFMRKYTCHPERSEGSSSLCIAGLSSEEDPSFLRMTILFLIIKSR